MARLPPGENAEKFKLTTCLEALEDSEGEISHKE